MRLIDADVLVADFMNYADLGFDGEGVANFVSHAPTIDPCVAVHAGNWKPVKCKKCNSLGLHSWKFCPNCGGKYEID